ncbi:LOW QUALITY PROTEIN: interferon-induced very large GTPase 1-like [Thalassophryne amazonica]|uniref:LOW QUALITY PROTEIN: interferon-induced very large GTPase 1-like n=1 Tax=Thalassophryne amazonica TaxID=390379 RepID=UPI0014721CED|nr:LOW QUALITY PROTEIN: interferon-induced very large GTPase 1-like [Thalassophryne amazonica]
MDGHKEKISEETAALLSRLHLPHEHQQKFTPGQFLEISPPVNQHCETSEKDLAHAFLQRLLMLDYRARYISVENDSTEVSESDQVGGFQTQTGNSDFQAFLRSSVKSGQTKQTHVHPMDVQMAVFHCSDSFLRQTIVTKLSQCQYALPLLVPDPVTAAIECPLWTFRQIRKSWKKTQLGDSNTVTMNSLPIYKVETPLVSFVRLGSTTQSKSQLMNALINDRHSTFFHRNSPGSTKSHYLMDGVAEIAWYCPAGKPNDAFNDCIAFCNLHGDAMKFEKQHDTLIEKSSVTVVLVSSVEDSNSNLLSVLSALFESQKPLICLFVNDECDSVEIKTGKYKMGLKDRSQSSVFKALKIMIGNILRGPHVSFQLETMAKVSGIRVDEDNKICQKGKDAATKLMNLLQGMKISEVKNKFLPCQGHLLRDWCRVNKEHYHLTGHVEDQKCKNQEELMQIRQKQCDASFGDLIKLFTESLESLTTVERKYFLKWTQILMDDLSTDEISSLLQMYDDKWSEVLALKKKHDKYDQLNIKQAELDKISEKLQSATFGLEHIFREMGQIYEAHASRQKMPNGSTDWSKYPELAAELMISGQPMELMDGDAGHVPLKWIKSLFEEVIKKLGDIRIFVLSVLGIQSSGKSTMLNSMFGLQFAVSAGRCTKGAFMQLLKVSEDMKKDFKFDFILVVDTEGLRALELAGSSTLHHDNELATFVIGLANMTLINIFGENPADMQDVLQIVVQAFMRMKKVKLSPSCVFVHQNVTDISAAKKNMEGKRCLQEKLDQMAQLAAKEEGCDSECFSDVIAFDVQKDVKYFAQLWEGSPPMAPPNPGYSESIQDLKKFIISKASDSAGMTLSNFTSNIHDLWDALLNENFVFSFKNTYEIAVYRKLEVQYGTWTWALRSNMLTVENQLYNKIENGNLQKVELSFLYEEMRKSFEEIQTNMKTYFSDNRDKEILSQWRGRFEQKIKEFHEEQVKGVQRKLDEVLQQKEACKKLDDKNTDFESTLLQKSKELAHQLKDKAKDKEELKNHFDRVWEEWVTELTRNTRPIEDINLGEDVKSVLVESFGFDHCVIEKRKKIPWYKFKSDLVDYSSYVTPHKLCQKQLTEVNTEKFTLPCEVNQLFRSFITNVEKDGLAIMKSKPVATRGYSSAYLQEVAKNVKEQVDPFEKRISKEYVLKRDFTVDLLLYVFHRAEDWLLDSHRKFKMKYDARIYVQSKKEQYYGIFQSFCKGNSSAVVFGELICEKLKDSTVQAVCNKTAIGLAGEMKCSLEPFSGNRLNLEKHVLKTLAEREDFDGYKNYITHPKEEVEKFIRDEVKKYIFITNKEKTQSIVKKNTEDLGKLVSQALFDATEKVKTEEGDAEMWLKEFSRLLNDELTCDKICCQNFSDIKEFDFLKEVIDEGLLSIISEVKNLSLDKMEEFRLKPDQILIDQLCKCCWVQCPFCAAVCTNTLEDHSPEDHSVSFHRPSGIKGWHCRGTVEMGINFCTTNVESDGKFYPHRDSDVLIPYKQYRTAGPNFANWKITHDESKLTYWKWVVCRFQEDLEEHYKLKFEGRGRIPKEWKKHTKAEAIQSLDEM